MKARTDDRIERTALQELFVASTPGSGAGRRPLWGLDATSIARPQARTSADRTALLVHHLPHNQTVPVTAGWHFSTLVVLPEEPSSWCYILESRRIASAQTPAEVAAAQLSELVALLPQGVRPIVMADRPYPSVPFLQATAAVACDKLLRCASNRVFYRPAPPPTGKRAAPRKDGERFACSDRSHAGVKVDEHWEGEDESGHHIEVDRWDHLHLRKAREIDLSVIRLSRASARGNKRDPRVSWLVWVGQLVNYKAKMDMSPELAAMTAQFCATVTMLFNTLAGAYTQLSQMKWTPQQGWAYSGGNFTVAVGGNRGVFVETAQADFNQLFQALVGNP